MDRQRRRSLGLAQLRPSLNRVVRSWDVAEDLPPIDVGPLFQGERDALVALLGSLPDDGWWTPTELPGWNVHDLALHLLADDLGRLRRRPPGAAVATRPRSFRALARSIERSNEAWVGAARRIPPELVIEWLARTGSLVAGRFAARDRWDESLGVAWIGTGPSPVWLDAAREYMERWIHQQHIRAAMGRPGMLERRWYHPVLEAAMRALPRTYAGVPAPARTRVRVAVSGDAGGAWTMERRARRWQLVADARDAHAAIDAEVTLPEAGAWRVLTRSAGAPEAAAMATRRGDPALTSPVLRAAAVMTTAR
jgi:uncharacterized protein (TIGR03083 family)